MSCKVDCRRPMFKKSSCVSCMTSSLVYKLVFCSEIFKFSDFIVVHGKFGVTIYLSLDFP